LDQQFHMLMDLFENDEEFIELIGLRDYIPVGDNKKGFSIQLDTYEYFGEEEEMCGHLNKKVVSKSKNTLEKPCARNKHKSRSDKLFEALIEKLNEETMEKMSYPFKNDDELPKEVDLTLPPDPTQMEDASKMFLEETISVTMGLEEEPRMIKTLSSTIDGFCRAIKRICGYIFMDI
ncbi:hypothetical protein KI387_009961, partial [Taxus chinensis]